MGLRPTNFKRNLFAIINYAQILLSTVAAVSFPGWVSSGYLSDCYFEIGNFCFQLWIPVAISTFGSLIGGIWWTIKKYKDTGSLW